ncbi:MAG: hypothetical protein ACLTT2_07480 [Alphaproteobacteria bacterium]
MTLGLGELSNNARQLQMSHSARAGAGKNQAPRQYNSSNVFTNFIKKPHESF